MLNIKAIKGFTGQIPTSIFNISSLKTTDLSNNSLSSSLPNDMCQHLPKLEGLYLSWNELSGNIPSGQILEEIGNLLSLEMLNIKAIKGLTGQIPTSIFNISSLKTIELSNNSLSGSLPNYMCQNLKIDLVLIQFHFFLFLILNKLIFKVCR
ncbi:hypothetical protein Gotur_029812 [Gossypium turneri]